MTLQELQQRLAQAHRLRLSVGWLWVGVVSSGLEAPMTIAEPTDRDIFLPYVEQVLCARLRPGQVVILDNLSAHEVAGARELIEAAGAQLLYLPLLPLPHPTQWLGAWSFVLIPADDWKPLVRG